MSNQPPLNPAARTECVDMLLEIMGYPRDELFEYPHRADDSIRYITRAERTLDKILAVAQPEAKAEAWDECVDYAPHTTHERKRLKADNPYRGE